MKGDVSTLDELKKLSVEDAFKKFSSSKEGIDDASVKERINKYGYNEITEKRVNPIVKFLSYFWGPIP
jgi:H+-transporting ATPase